MKEPIQTYLHVPLRQTQFNYHPVKEGAQMKLYFYLIVVALPLMTQACTTTGVRKDSAVEHVWQERHFRNFDHGMK